MKTIINIALVLAVLAWMAPMAMAQETDSLVIKNQIKTKNAGAEQQLRIQNQEKTQNGTPADSGQGEKKQLQNKEQTKTQTKAQYKDEDGNGVGDQNKLQKKEQKKTRTRTKDQETERRVQWQHGSPERRLRQPAGTGFGLRDRQRQQLSLAPDFWACRRFNNN